DANGCTTTESVTITQPASALSASAVVNANVLCFGNATGAATVMATGGTSPYTYSWSNGATTASISNVIAGTYSVTVTDVNGCQDTASVTITQPSAALSVQTISFQNVSCFGGSTGSASATVTGGTPPYSHSWSSGGTTANVTGLAAGSHTYTVTDANGCTASMTINITQPGAPVTANSTVLSNVNCFGGSDGEAYITYSGGTPPYTVTWNNGSTADTISNLTAGTYVATITDANGCQVTETVSITQPVSALSSNLSLVNPILCNGSMTGSVNVIASGGTAPYSYSWSNGSSATTLINLPAGTYSVTITDANGCTVQDSIAVTQPSPLMAHISIQNAVTCFGGSDGSLAASATGGTGPYTFSWGNGSTSPNISNLPAGTYTVTVTDANGCIQQSTVQISQPASGVTASTVSTSHVSCNAGSDGSATVSATGGSGPYSYSWSNGQTGTTATGLAAGTYTVTVTDASGCTTSHNVTINEPTPIAITKTSSVNVNCFNGNDGFASISVSGGTSPYSISWDNGGTGNSIGNLTAGTYVATVTDANGCQDTAVFAIFQPSNALSAANGFIQNVSCFDGNDGAAYVDVMGGTAPYSISWSNGSSNDTISNLGAGSYTAVVTDANGCIDSTTVVITQPATGITATLTVHQHVYCKGELTGILAVDVTGGTAPYSLNWSNGSTSDSLSYIAAGTYTLTVTDANGCVETYTAVVNEPNNALASTPTVLNPVYCYGEANGMARVQPSGGTAPYTITWSNGATGDTAQGLAVGRYYITITDASGCLKTDSVDINGPNQDLNVNPSVVNVNCGGMNSGEISLNPIGGTPPYNVTWAHGASGAYIGNLPVGSYPVTIIDGAGCTVEDTIEVTENDPVISDIDVLFATCPNSADGYVSITSQGGTPPYQYYFDGVPFNGTRSDLTPGSHELTIQDAIGCDTTFFIYVGVDQESNYLHIPNAFTPNGDRINEDYKIFGSECIGPSRFQIFDRWGNLVFSSHDPLNEFWDGYRPDGTRCKEDVYVWVFKSADFERRGHVTVVH
ncbi:MAG: gliding motility-associated C-terminal domain-containing protein, partial [Flavobacteriia bacterium]|nr:gliding motility-associated C-terminal domain-containing protein [Flavobacteriia bacterium]